MFKHILQDFSSINNMCLGVRLKHLSQDFSNINMCLRVMLKNVLQDFSSMCLQVKGCVAEVGTNILCHRVTRLAGLK